MKKKKKEDSHEIKKKSGRNSVLAVVTASGWKPFLIFMQPSDVPDVNCDLLVAFLRLLYKNIWIIKPRWRASVPVTAVFTSEQSDKSVF